MPFQARNSYHLRLSTHTVLPLIVYLDENHIEWMSERTLKSVVDDLRDLLGPKLQAERDAHLGPGGPANAKRGSVDVHRGVNYQFAYFFRKADPHYVLLKTRNFRMEPFKPQLRPPPRASTKKRREAQKRKKTKSKAAGKRPARAPRDDDDDDDDYFVSGTSSEDAEEVEDGDANDGEFVPALEIEEEEEKPKATMELSYKQFDIQDRCICIIVEPWPAGQVPAVYKDSVQSGSIAPTTNEERAEAQTPLFMPERGQSIVPSMDVDDDAATRAKTADDPNNFSLLEFSQALTSFGDQLVGFEDDDEIEGDVLFADADEMRNVVQ